VDDTYLSTICITGDNDQDVFNCINSELHERLAPCQSSVPQIV